MSKCAGCDGKGAGLVAVVVKTADEGEVSVEYQIATPIKQPSATATTKPIFNERIMWILGTHPARTEYPTPIVSPIVCAAARCGFEQGLRRRRSVTPRRKVHIGRNAYHKKKQPRRAP